ADGGDIVASLTGCVEQRLFVQIIAAIVRRKIGENLVVLDKGRRSARCEIEVAGVEGRITGPDGIAEVSGVAEAMSGGDSRSVRGGEGGKEGMAVGKVNALLANREQRRRVFVGDGTGPQPVGDEDDDVMARLGVLMALLSR